MDSKQASFNGYKVELKKMRLRDANTLFPFVMSAMTKMSLGNFNFFNDLKPIDIELFQEKLCENVYKIEEKKKENGDIVKSKINLSLSDLDECVEGFLPLLVVFLEFNFGFFSQAQKILDPILNKVSESAEK
jgi:hypothetical protein